MISEHNRGYRDLKSPIEETDLLSRGYADRPKFCRHFSVMPTHLILIAASLAIAIGDLSCRSGGQPQAGKSGSLKQTLLEVKGTYIWRDDLNRYHYSEKPRLEDILSTYPPEEAVSALVECLDDTSPSQSLIDGSPVSAGIVCYEALTQLVYYEPTAPDGDIAANWPGHISPQASPLEMREAKKAWMEVAEAKLFIFQ